MEENINEKGKNVYGKVQYIETDIKKKKKIKENKKDKENNCVWKDTL